MSFKDEEIEAFPLYNSIDNAILMHRDAHFGGKFAFMIDYYRQEKKGVSPDFELERILSLAAMENQMGQNLAPILLTGPEAERVAQAKEAYKKLRDLYESRSLRNKIPLLIANLILSEEESPEEEIQAILQEGAAAVPSLIELVKAEDFYDPLFPGYGFAPSLAVQCLGRIGDRRSIIALFESIGQNDFFDEDAALEALKAVGQPAKEFLLKVLRAHPLNEDNEKAAIALIAFKEDPAVAIACFELLKEPETRKNISLATYLILACDHLPKEYKQAFSALAEDPLTPKALKQDIYTIAHG